jgi:hypothetical protein
MEPQSFIFDRLFDARSSLVGKASVIQVEAPTAFACRNASVDLRPVETLDEVSAIAEASARRLRSVDQK